MCVVMGNMIRKKQRQKKWMTPGSSSHEALKKFVIDKVLIKDMEKMNKNINITYLEVFHSLKIWSIPKTIFFEQEKMVAGAKLADLDHNTNISCEQVGLIDILLWLVCPNSICKNLLNPSNENHLKNFLNLSSEHPAIFIDNVEHVSISSCSIEKS